MQSAINVNNGTDAHKNANFDEDFIRAVWIFWSFDYLIISEGVIAGLPPQPKNPNAASGGIPKTWLVYLGILLFVPACAYLLLHPHWVETWMLKVLGPIVALYMLFEIARARPGERGKIVVILVLVFFSITFWACFEQAGSSMTLFTRDHVDKVVLGWEVPPSVFQAINPAFILLLAPVFSWLWVFLGRANKCGPDIRFLQ